MKVIRHTTIDGFRQQTLPFLAQREAIHNVKIGVAGRYPDGFPEDAFFGHVEDATGTIVAAAMRTPPHGVVLSAIDDPAALPVLVDAFAALYDSLPTVLGAADDAQPFAELWQEKRGQLYSLKMQQGIYKLERVNPMPDVAGDYRPATQNERELLIDWVIAFSEEAMDEDQSRDEAAEIVDRKLAGELTDTLRLWWHANQPVSLAGSTRPTPHGVCIGPVYTPPELRGKGYASAVTAKLSQELLDSGRDFCFLFTDMANPTSNKIYQNIGYNLVIHQHLYQFHDPA